MDINKLDPKTIEIIRSECQKALAKLNLTVSKPKAPERTLVVNGTAVSPSFSGQDAQKLAAEVVKHLQKHSNNPTDFAAMIQRNNETSLGELMKRSRESVGKPKGTYQDDPNLSDFQNMLNRSRHNV